MTAQNWDASTATPAGWSLDTGWTIGPYATAPSQPNALGYSASTATAAAATRATSDGAGGNVVVATSFLCFQHGQTQCAVGLAARRNSTAPGADYYLASVDFALSQASISRVSAGSATTLATAYGAALSNSHWYRLFFALSGPALSLSVQDLANGQWLTAAGGWQTAEAPLLTASDTSISGAGFSGIVAQSQGVAGLETDDFELDAYAAPAPPLPFALRQGPRAPRPGLDRPGPIACLKPAPAPPEAKLLPFVAPSVPGRPARWPRAVALAPPRPSTATPAATPPPRRARRAIVRPPLVHAPPITVAPLPGLIAVPAVAGRRAVPPRPTRLAPPVTSFYPDTVHPSGAFSLGSFPTD